MSDAALSNVGVRLSTETKERLDKAAARRGGGIRASHIIRMAIDAFLDADEAAAGKPAPATKPSKTKK